MVYEFLPNGKTIGAVLFSDMSYGIRIKRYNILLLFSFIILQILQNVKREIKKRGKYLKTDTS